MKNVEMNVVKFSNEDVIATSGNSFQIAGIGNGNRQDNYLAGVKLTSVSDSKMATVSGAVSEALGTTVSIGYNTLIYYDKDSTTASYGINKVFGSNNKDDDQYAIVNGTYEYRSGAFYRI